MGSRDFNQRIRKVLMRREICVRRLLSICLSHRTLHFIRIGFKYNFRKLEVKITKLPIKKIAPLENFYEFSFYCIAKLMMGSQSPGDQIGSPRRNLVVPNLTPEIFGSGPQGRNQQAQKRKTRRPKFLKWGFSELI